MKARYYMRYEQPLGDGSPAEGLPSLAPSKEAPSLPTRAPSYEAKRGAPKAQDRCASKRHPFYAETSMTTLQSATSYRHFERSEKSLSFAVSRSMIGNSKRETCYPLTFGHRPIYIAAKLPLQP